MEFGKEIEVLKEHHTEMRMEMKNLKSQIKNYV